jgi:hypothetical protein
LVEADFNPGRDGGGEKDEAPMLYIGEQTSDSSEPTVDIAVDHVDGNTLLCSWLTYKKIRFYNFNWRNANPVVKYKGGKVK